MQHSLSDPLYATRMRGNSSCKTLRFRSPIPHNKSDPIPMEESHEMPAYNYAPLPGDDYIRILELKASTDKDAPLRSSLKIARLDHDDYPYDALSYTWGVPVLSHTLYIQDILPSKTQSDGGFYSMRITSNLSNLLRNMRDQYYTRMFWVDAVCINQQDDVEKSNQIPLMFRIYQQAHRVAIWLGDSAEDQRRMRLMNIFARQRVRQTKIVSTMSDDELKSEKEAILRLTELPWFSRLWVVQEAVVNTDVTMYCGVEKISLVRLVDTVKVLCSLSELQPVRLKSFLRMGDLWDEHARSHPSDISSRRCNGERPCATVDVMQKFEHFGCADPRDRVYAISTLQKCIRIVPDYRLSSQQVFIDLAYSMRDHGQLQWVLQEAAIRQCGRKTPGFPSWIPDLSIRPIRRRIYAKHLEVGHKIIGDATDVSASRQKDGSDAICFTNCYLYKDDHGGMHGTMPCHPFTWRDIWDHQCKRYGHQHLTSARLRFDSRPMIATWRGDSFPDQPELAEAKAWIKTTLELVWQQFSKRAATVSLGASKRQAWRQCIATVASTIVADGAHIGELHPITSKEVQELSDSISDIFRHGEFGSRVRSKGYSRLLTICLHKLVEDTIEQTPMADAFMRLVIITMQGRCFFTCDIDENVPSNRAVIACGIGPSHMQVGDQALLHYMPFWEQAYLMRACGKTEEQSLGCFELVGDCYLKEPVGQEYRSQSRFKGELLPIKDRKRTIILK